jgi:ACT domain-containing protein
MAVISKGESFWRHLISQREVLKLTVDEACQQAGVSRASFYHWQKRVRKANGAEQAILL